MSGLPIPAPLSRAAAEILQELLRVRQDIPGGVVQLCMLRDGEGLLWRQGLLLLLQRRPESGGEGQPCCFCCSLLKGSKAGHSLYRSFFHWINRPLGRVPSGVEGPES